MAAWPDTLPKPLLSGFQGDAGANVARTDMDAGPARQRLRYGDSPDALNVGWLFKPAEMPLFKAFWSVDINKGADWFLMDIDIGDGLQSYEVRLVAGHYQYQKLSGGNWQVTANLDVRTI